MNCRFGLLLNFLDIQCAQAPVVDQDPAIHDDISHIAPAGISHKLRHNVDARTLYVVRAFRTVGLAI
jgi:hypothetical protein